MAYFVGLVAFLLVLDIAHSIYRKHKENIGKRPWSEY